MKYVLLLLLALTVTVYAQPASTPGSVKSSGQLFEAVADAALARMADRAAQLNIKGAAVLAYFEGDSVKSWHSRMVVVGSMKNSPTEKDRGSNLLGIAYSKAAEMAETLKDSGHAGRPPMTGETGWQGGLIRKGKAGYIIAAFSGGPSELDLKVAEAGLAVLAEKL